MTFAPTPLAAVREARAWREVIAPTQQVRRSVMIVIVAVGRWERRRARCSYLGTVTVVAYLLPDKSFSLCASGID